MYLGALEACGTVDVSRSVCVQAVTVHSFQPGPIADGASLKPACRAAITVLEPRTTAVLFPFRPPLLTALTGLF